MKEAFFKERGLYYRMNDVASNGPTLVFIHGLSGSSSAWADYEQAFGADYKILSVDLRGHGMSCNPDDYNAYEVEKIADDVAALLDHLGITSFIPISHSFGTFVAVSLLRRHREGAVAAIFLSSTYGIFRIPLTRATRLFVRACTRIARLLSYPEKPGIHVDYSKYRTTGDWNLRRISADLPNVTVHVYLYCLDHIYAEDHDSWWHDIRIPALIVHGTRDTISPYSHAVRLSREMPNARLATLEGANHILPLNRFEETRDTIGGYLNERIDLLGAEHAK